MYENELDYLLDLCEQGDKIDSDSLKGSLVYIKGEKEQLKFVKENIISKIYYCKKYINTIDDNNKMIYLITESLLNKELCDEKKIQEIKKALTPYYQEIIEKQGNFSLGLRLQRIKDEIVSN